MQFDELIRVRRSVRAYRPDPIPDETLAKVLDAARLAPTAGNRQPFRLIVVHTKGRESDLAKVYSREWFVRAPIVICACGIPSEARARGDGGTYLEVDIGIVMDHLVLAATDLGLGTCWVGAFDRTAARQALSLPDSVTPIAFTPLGYPDDQPSPKKRRSLSELVLYEHW